MSKAEIAERLSREDLDGIKELAGERLWRVLRYLIGRLPSADEAEKHRAVRALGEVVADPGIVAPGQATELMRRFLWALNDESGAVPFGIPEAMGEVISRRPELLARYLPIVASFLTSEEMRQTGPIERGVVWALGRVGQPVRDLAPNAIAALEQIGREHTDPDTRRAALSALERIGS